MTTELSISCSALPTAEEAPEERKFWKKVKRTAARLPFADKLVSSWYYATDAKTPKRTKMVLFGALAYFMMPLDAVPDLMVGAGYVDDGALLLATWAFLKGVPEEFREKAHQTLKALRIAKTVVDLADL